MDPEILESIFPLCLWIWGATKPHSSSLCCPQDMRKHVTMTLLDTEQSYVESLRTLMQVRPAQPRSSAPSPREQTHLWDRGLRTPQECQAGWKPLQEKTRSLQVAPLTESHEPY